MSRKPVRANLPDGTYNIVVRVPGWLKNDVVDFCASGDMGINEWLSTVILSALRAGRGLPPAPEPSHPLPTTADEIRAYMSGERLTQPCGRTDCKPELQQLQNMLFCKNCGVRAK